jgi:hypothetical protein
VAGTEPIPNWCWGNTELVGTKVKNLMGFLKPNFELPPNRTGWEGIIWMTVCFCQEWSVTA